MFGIRSPLVRSAWLLQGPRERDSTVRERAKQFLDWLPVSISLRSPFPVQGHASKAKLVAEQQQPKERFVLSKFKNVPTKIDNKQTLPLQRD